MLPVTVFVTWVAWGRFFCFCPHVSSIETGGQKQKDRPLRLTEKLPRKGGHPLHSGTLVVRHTVGFGGRGASDKEDQDNDCENVGKHCKDF